MGLKKKFWTKLNVLILLTIDVEEYFYAHVLQESFESCFEWKQTKNTWSEIAFNFAQIMCELDSFANVWNSLRDWTKLKVILILTIDVKEY